MFSGDFLKLFNEMHIIHKIFNMDSNRRPMADSKIENAVSKMLGLDRYDFDKVIIHKPVLENAVDFAKANVSKEFVALLSGSVKNRVLYIEAIIYQHYASDSNSALIRSVFFPLPEAIGSVHSHPGPSGRPSSADLRFFSNNGLFHLIISAPFSLCSFSGYTKSGEPADFYVYEPDSGKVLPYLQICKKQP
jgi:proteasome lid subunit RPN8/RPN11